MYALSRRDLLRAAGALGALGAMDACSSSKPKPQPSPGPSPSAGTAKAGSVGGVTDPSKAPFDTVVVLMMENRSFDHLLGWMPGVNGKQAGLRYPDRSGKLVPTYPLGSMTQACNLKDPSHDWRSVAKQYANGRCDGWLVPQVTGDHFPIGYYGREQVPVLSALAEAYTLFDAYHASLLAATWPNRFYQLAAATDVDETGFFPGAGQPRPSKLSTTIFDRVKEAGLTAGYYTWGEPMTELFASRKYDSITYPKDRFFADAKAGKLPNVTFVDPDYTTISEFRGTSNDDHPHGDLEAGEAYMKAVYDAVRTSPQWDRTVMVLTYDEHGGFYDHVVPPRVTDDNVNPNPGPHPDYGRLGFRVPAVAISPFAPRKVEKAGPYEHCSTLRMIEWRWGLEPLTARDRNARNLAEALDFTTRRDPVDVPSVARTTSPACPNPTIELA